MVSKIRLYSAIPNKLYFSARTHQLDDYACCEFVRNANIDFVVNLWHTKDTRLTQICQYEHIPMADGQLKPAVRDQARYAASRVVDALFQDRSVLVHCWGGRNRSCLVAALAMISYIPTSGTEAIERIRAARRGALSNKYFVEYLNQMGTNQ